MKNKIDKKKIKALIFLPLGNFILSLGSGLFIVPNHIITGGVAGIEVLLHPFISLSPSLVVFLLNVLLFVIGFVFLGKGFALKTAVSTILYPMFLALVIGVTQGERIVEDPLIASVFGGILTGIGIGLVFLVEGSTGGMDIIPLVINKYSKISIPFLVFITDMLTIIFGFFIYGTQQALVGAISVWLGSVLIDKTMLMGSISARQVTIISKKHEEINQLLLEKLDRGSTIYTAEGGYTGEQTKIVMMVISNKQYIILQRIVQSVDPHAFIIVSEIQEVNGLGFTNY